MLYNPKDPFDPLNPWSAPNRLNDTLTVLGDRNKAIIDTSAKYVEWQQGKGLPRQAELLTILVLSHSTNGGSHVAHDYRSGPVTFLFVVLGIIKLLLVAPFFIFSVAFLFVALRDLAGLSG